MTPIGRRLFLASPLALLHSAGPAAAQAQDQSSASTTFSVDVRLVNAAFIVRDRAGRLAPGLSRDDFEIFEDRRRQEIRMFSREEETPLTIGLVIDRSGSQDQFEQENVFAAVTFFRSILRQQDRAFVVAFGDRIKLVHAATASLDDLEGGLKRMKKEFTQLPALGPSEKREGGSAVIDAAYWSVHEKMRDVPGRKAIVMIGDGRENSSTMQLVSLIDILQTNDVLFYGLDNGGEDTKASRRHTNQMPLIADESGGRVIDTRRTPLRRAFEEIEQELRTLYTLAYQSTNPARDGRYRKLEIRPKDNNLTIRARPGYYAR